MMPLSTAQRGKLHGNLSRSQQTLLSILPSMPALNCSLAWDPDSRRFPLQAFGFISPPAPSQLFSETLYALQRRKIRSICLELWELLASFLLRKQLESCPQKLICKLHSLQKFYQLAHFKQVFTEGWESWTG